MSARYRSMVPLAALVVMACGVALAFTFGDASAGAGTGDVLCIAGPALYLCGQLITGLRYGQKRRR